jgi:hypothetical protein
MIDADVVASHTLPTGETTPRFLTPAPPRAHRVRTRRD